MTTEKLNQLRIDRSADDAPSRNRRTIALAVVLTGAMAAGAWGWSRHDEPPAVSIAMVTAANIGNDPAGSTASVLDATGYVVARRIATVSAKVTGRVREVLIEEGQHVDAGDVMATLDPVDARAQRALAAAQVDAARSLVESMRTQLGEADADVDRLQTLVNQRLVARSQYEQAVSRRDTLRAELQHARRNTEVAERQLAIADNGVDNTIVRAPFAGVVVAKSAQPGEIVSPLSAGGGFTRTGIGTIVDMESLEIEVDVSESFIGRVRPGMHAVATLNAYPDWEIPTRVVAIIPTADRGKATVRIRIALPPKDPRVVPDMGVRVRFLADAEGPSSASETAPVLLLPASAVVDTDTGPIAFVDVDGTARRRELRLGRQRGAQREVLSGLERGARVIVDPPTALKDGSPIAITDADHE